MTELTPMRYNKYTWQNGELITEAKLNRMEAGIEAAYNRAERRILQVIQDDTTLTDLIAGLISNYSFSVSDSNETLTIGLVNNSINNN